MISLNKIMIIGNLGKDAEHRFTQNNKEVSSFTVATTYSYKVNDEWKNETTWHNVVLFGASDYVKNNLVKGTTVFVEGRLNKRDYENKEGQKIYVTEIIADKVMPFTVPNQNKVEITENNQSSNEDDDLPF